MRVLSLLAPLVLLIAAACSDTAEAPGEGTVRFTRGAPTAAPAEPED